TVITLTFTLSDEEVGELNKKLLTKVQKGFSFATTHSYANKSSIGISIDEKPVIAALASSSSLSTDAQKGVKAAGSFREIPDALKSIDQSEKDKAFLSQIATRIAEAQKGGWDHVIEWEAWQWLTPRVPKFLYFGEYEVLPSKVNLNDL